MVTLRREFIYITASLPADYGYREVEAVEETNVGYKKAADLWSFGVLTACMFTGNLVVPPKELAELSQVEIAARFLGMDDQYARAEWQRIPPRALEFIRRLLVIDPDNRITVDEALDHPWYSKPPREAEALTQALRRINQFWKPHEKDDEIIQTLPGVVLNAAPPQKPPLVKSRKKVPDTSLSPYFGLGRHLVQRTQSTRKRILEDLTEPGSQFIAIQGPEMKLSRADARNFRARGAGEVILVGGEDLFGTSFATGSTTQFESCLEEMEHIPTTSIPRFGRDFGSDLSDPIIPPPIPPSIPEPMSADTPDTIKRGSKESARRVHGLTATAQELT
jgi:serine/threonine protein kinase